MKKVFVTMFAVVTVGTVSNAQEAKLDAPKKMEAAPMQPKISKEQKEAQLAEAFKTAGLTADEQTKARQVLDEANAKSKEVKSDAKLSDEEKKAKSKEVSDTKNAKLKEALGEAKFKALQQALKAQREAMKAPVKE
jgi:hypothetical protein